MSITHTRVASIVSVVALLAATLALILGTVVPVAAAPPSLAWARAMGGTGQDTGRAVAVDGSGNVYVTGYFRDTVDFDPGPGVFNIVSTGGDDVFVSKMDHNGKLVWAKAMGGTGQDSGFGLALDGSGNVHVVGAFSNTADFDPGPGVFNLVSSGLEDVFVSKLDNNGNLLWARAMGGTDFDYGLAVAVDGSGNVHTTGVFVDTVDFDPGPGVFNLVSTGLDDAFVSRLDSSGNFVWAGGTGGTGIDGGIGLAVDGSGNTYTTGLFSNTVDFDPGPGVFNLASVGDFDVFVSKLDGSGNLTWARAMGGPGADIGRGVAMDGSGNVHTTGEFSGTADFDPGPGVFNLVSVGGKDVFVSKLDGSGNLTWARAMGSTMSDGGTEVAVDGSGNVYAIGEFSGTADFDPGPGVFNLTSAGVTDVFISQLDSSGNFAWTGAMGGTTLDRGFGVAVDGSGNVHTTGRFTGTADFDPGPGLSNLVSAGIGDVFVSKLSDVTAPAVTVTVPAEGAVVTQNAVVLADYGCMDDPGGSGVASCVGDVASGAAIDAATLGAKTFTVTGTDNAGNTKAVTHNYTVISPPPTVADTVGVVNVDNAQWYLANSAGAVTNFEYGNPTDLPISGDWDGNPTSTPGLYRSLDSGGLPGGFFYARNSNSTGIANDACFGGNPSDIPVSGDWDGDGDDTLGIMRLVNNQPTFFMFNNSCVGTAPQSNPFQNALGAAQISFEFGDAGDTPVVGDWDGDGKDEIGLYRRSNGFFYNRETLSTGAAHNACFAGDPSDYPIGGDWDGDGDGNLGIYRPSLQKFFLFTTSCMGLAPPATPFANAMGAAQIEVSLPVAGADVTKLRPVSGNFGLG